MSDQLHTLALTRMRLHYFRNYESLDVSVPADRPILILGENGAGKTNLLEAVSLSVPGKGLRHGTWQEMQHEHYPHDPWVIHSTIQSMEGEATLGMQHQMVGQGEEYSSKRLIKIDGQLCRQPHRLSEMMKLFWLTPQMGYLLITGMSARRRFFDRLTTYFDHHHSRHLNLYEKMMRERLHLLKMHKPDDHWLSSLEQQMAEHGVAIAAARLQMLSYIQEQMEHLPSGFPLLDLEIQGEIECWLQSETALGAEEKFLKKLQENRQGDRQMQRTQCGVHRSQFILRHQLKDMLAERCSTGEQKMMMLTLILAVLYAQMRWHSARPVLLLDDVAAHVDMHHREALFSFLQRMGCQVWLTGTDEALFTPLLDDAFVLKIEMSNCITVT